MRLVYLGTPEMAVPPLRALVSAGHDVVLVVTQPDARRERGGKPTPSPVKIVAQELGIAVTENLADVLETSCDLGVVVAFGRIIPSEVLQHVKMVNVHFSLLPRWRGAAPVERAILAGDVQTGVDIMAVEAGLDTGGIYVRRTLDIGRKTLAELRLDLTTLGVEALLEVLARPGGIGEPEPQVGEATYAKKLLKTEFMLDPSQTVEHADRIVRLGRGVALVKDRRLVITSAKPSLESCPRGELRSNSHVMMGFADGALQLVEVIPEGSRPMDAASWWRGMREAELKWSGLGQAPPRL
jgi:methionyl-tRNA formyltransferase